MHDWFKLHLQAQVQLCLKKKHWQSYSTGDGQGPAKREKKSHMSENPMFHWRRTDERLQMLGGRHRLLLLLFGGWSDVDRQMMNHWLIPDDYFVDNVSSQHFFTNKSGRS